jgi:signal peptidase I
MNTLDEMTKLQRMRKNRLFELVFTIAVALGLALTVQAYAVKPFRIPSGSMEPTLKVGERVLVNRASHRLGASPKVGDIIVFMPPAGAGQEICGVGSEGQGSQTPCGASVARRTSPPFIKRVVGVAGDTIAIQDGHVIRNGKLAREPFTAPCGGGPDCNFPNAIRVPPGSVYVMGDNRGNSDDSRFWGPVPVSAVIGEAFASYWPPDRVGTL